MARRATSVNDRGRNGRRAEEQTPIGRRATRGRPMGADGPDQRAKGRGHRPITGRSITGRSQADGRQWDRRWPMGQTNGWAQADHRPMGRWAMGQTKWPMGVWAQADGRWDRPMGGGHRPMGGPSGGPDRWAERVGRQRPPRDAITRASSTNKAAPDGATEHSSATTATQRPHTARQAVWQGTLRPEGKATTTRGCA